MFHYSYLLFDSVSYNVVRSTVVISSLSFITAIIIMFFDSVPYIVVTCTVVINSLTFITAICSSIVCLTL